MRALPIFALLALASTSALAQAPCSQEQLAGNWLLSSAGGNSCPLTVQPDGRYVGRCTGPNFGRRGGRVRGDLTVGEDCVVTGSIRGNARNGTFGPLAIGPAALDQTGGLIAGVTNTGDGDQRHIFIMTKVP